MTTPDPTVDVAALAALLEAATPGPWGSFHHIDRPDEAVVTYDADLSIALCEHEHEPQFTDGDARLIAALRNAAPALLAAVEERDRLVAAIEGLRATMPHALGCGIPCDCWKRWLWDATRTDDASVEGSR